MVAPKIRLSFISLYEIRARLVAIMNHFLLASATVSGRSSASPIQGLSLHCRLIITHPGERTSSPDNGGLDRHHGQECNARGRTRKDQGGGIMAGGRQCPWGGEGQHQDGAPVGTWLPQVPFPAAPPDGGRK